VFDSDSVKARICRLIEIVVVGFKEGGEGERVARWGSGGWEDKGVARWGGEEAAWDLRRVAGGEGKGCSGVGGDASK
jgi:hypothetical protein